MGQIGDQLKLAGFRVDSYRCLAAVDRCLQANPRNIEAATEALFNRLFQETTLLWAHCEDLVRQRAAQVWSSDELRGGGHEQCAREGHGAIAPTSLPDDETEGQPLAADKASVAVPSVLSPQSRDAGQGIHAVKALARTPSVAAPQRSGGGHTPRADEALASVPPAAALPRNGAGPSIAADKAQLPVPRPVSPSNAPLRIPKGREPTEADRDAAFLVRTVASSATLVRMAIPGGSSVGRLCLARLPGKQAEMGRLIKEKTAEVADLAVPMAVMGMIYEKYSRTKVDQYAELGEIVPEAEAKEFRRVAEARIKTAAVAARGALADLPAMVGVSAMLEENTL